MSDLKPCPFCGGKASIETKTHAPPFAYCDDCGVSTTPELWNRRADALERRWVPEGWLAFDVGCIECGEESAVIGVFATEKEAEAACEIAREKQKKDWTGQHSMEVFKIAAAPSPPAKREGG